MIVSLIYKSPIWSDLDANSRLMRVIIAGTIVYICLHSFLYSKYVESNESVLKYRNYILYIAALDLVTVIGLFYMGGSNDKKIKKKQQKKSKRINEHMREQLDTISPDIQMKAQQEYDMIKLEELKRKMDIQKQANSPKPLSSSTGQVIKPKAPKTDDEKSKELFVTQDEITTHSIPVYKSKKDVDSIPMYGK